VGWHPHGLDGCDGSRIRPLRSAVDRVSRSWTRRGLWLFHKFETNDFVPGSSCLPRGAPFITVVWSAAKEKPLRCPTSEFDPHSGERSNCTICSTPDLGSGCTASGERSAAVATVRWPPAASGQLVKPPG
jgi:hypothetical protein